MCDKHAHVCMYIELYSVLLHVLLRISDIMVVEGDEFLSVPYVVNEPLLFQHGSAV